MANDDILKLINTTNSSISNEKSVTEDTDKINIYEGLKYLINIQPITNNIYITKKHLLFRDFLNTKQSKKFLKNIIKTTGIYIEIYRKNNTLVNITLSIFDESNYRHCIKCVLSTKNIMLDDYTIVVLEYIVRLCSILLFLKDYISNITEGCFYVQKYHFSERPYTLDKIAFLNRWNIEIVETKVTYNKHEYKILSY